MTLHCVKLPKKPKTKTTNPHTMPNGCSHVLTPPPPPAIFASSGSVNELPSWQHLLTVCLLVVYSNITSSRLFTLIIYLGWGGEGAHIWCLLEVKRQLARVGSLFVPRVTQELNSGLRAWQPVPFPTEQSRQAPPFN